MSYFSEQIAKLTIPAPNIDPEDDINEVTRARLIDKNLLDSDLDEPSSSQKISKIRKSLALTVDDPQYKGKIVTRKDLDLDDSDSLSEPEMESNDEPGHYAGSGSDEDMSDDDFDDNFNANDSDGNYDDSIEEFEDDEEIDSDEAMGVGDEPAIFRGKKEASDKEKGKDTMNQISLWESILEARIKIQKLLGVANQLPRPSDFDTFMDQGGNDLSSSIKSTTSSLTSLASEMFKLQEKLLSQVERNSTENVEKGLETSNVYKEDEWNEAIEKRCARLRSRRNKILKFWYDKTLISSGNRKKSFSSFERPTVDQIEQILADRDRLIRRTRVQRTKYRVLGTAPEEKGADEKDGHNLHLKETDEIFDDDDFYQQLLRQFIEQKTSQSQPESSDALQNSILMTRNWLKLQHLATKQKKIVDTKASKGRKVRYTVHPKLVSFMAPVDSSKWTHESRNQLVKTMFGKSLLSNDVNS